jgi:hypothetical protein
MYWSSRQNEFCRAGLYLFFSRHENTKTPKNTKIDNTIIYTSTLNNIKPLRFIEYPQAINNLRFRLNREEGWIFKKHNLLLPNKR